MDEYMLIRHQVNFGTCRKSKFGTVGDFGSKLRWYEIFVNNNVDISTMYIIIKILSPVLKFPNFTITKKYVLKILGKVKIFKSPVGLIIQTHNLQICRYASYPMHYDVRWKFWEKKTNYKITLDFIVYFDKYCTS